MENSQEQVKTEIENKLSEMAFRISEIRKSKGLTRMKAAEVCKLSYATYCNVESGRTKPRFDTLAKIAVGFDLNLLSAFV